jgi:6-phosphogluconolactonase/glucosamine-6-phosphate isomerase/deaminase
MAQNEQAAAEILASDINKSVAEGRQVTVWLASGKMITDVVSAAVSGPMMTINHEQLTWRFRIDHVVGITVQ